MMKISNVPSLTFKTPRVYINMTDNPIKVHTREHYTAIPNHDITLQYASILKKKKKNVLKLQSKLSYTQQFLGTYTHRKTHSSITCINTHTKYHIN